jgi:hypothetical protein
VITLLLDRRGDDVKITDEVIKAAVGNERSGGEVDTREDAIPRAFQRALQRSSESITKLHLAMARDQNYAEADRDLYGVRF